MLFGCGQVFFVQLVDVDRLAATVGPLGPEGILGLATRPELSKGLEEGLLSERGVGLLEFLVGRSSADLAEQLWAFSEAQNGQKLRVLLLGMPGLIGR